MKNDDTTAHMSIGGLSRASGIAVETLRNWERRYGFPEPVRRQSGHRRYPFDIVPRLRIIKKAIDAGYKPSFCVATDENELRAILDSTIVGEPRRSPGHDGVERAQEIARWHRAVELLDTQSLETGLQRTWLRLGAVTFINDMVVPFLREVGEKWFKNVNTVAHEHFASEITMSFLARKWRPLSIQATGPKVVLANFEGELHCLGLHMAAVFLTLYNVEMIFLGPNTPLKDIALAALEQGTVAVIIGTSPSAEVTQTTSRLAELVKAVPSNIVVAVGGNLSLPQVPGVTMIASFEDFNVWARTLAEGALKSAHLSSSP